MSTNWSLIQRLMVAAQPRQGGQGRPASRNDSSTSSHSSCTADCSWQGMPTKTRGSACHTALREQQQQQDDRGEGESE